MMKERSKIFIGQALCTPIVAIGLAVLSWHLCAKGGFWLALPAMWLAAFFILGFCGAHGMFYICALPLSDSEEPRPAIVRAIQAFWFLQVPFALFNGINPVYSIPATQGLIAIIAVGFSIMTGKGKPQNQASGDPLERRRALDRSMQSLCESNSMADNTDIFAEAERRQKRLFEQLMAAPISDMLAVVGANGPGAGRSRGEDTWTMSFTVEAWRVGAGEFQKRPLTVCRKVTDEEIKRYQDLIQPYEVIRLKARIVESNLGAPQALLEAFVGRDFSDAELNRVAQELQKPVTFEDPLLGLFTLDRRVDWFVGTVIWAGQPISLNLSGSADAQGALKTAHALWQSQAEWNRRVRCFAVEELLPLKNDSWLEEDEAELTPDEFEERMKLESIRVSADGSFDFWHNDGDLFLGHSIQVSGSLSEGPTQADIPG